jgi:AcrR family transcriptional regulator
VGHIHSRETILTAAVHVVRQVGLTRLTYRLVGRQLGIPDRTVVYYFATKRDLVLAVLEVVREKVDQAMRASLDGHGLTVDQALAGMWRALATDELGPYFGIYIELLGLAVARVSPYEELAPRIYQYWIDWLEPRMTGPAGQRRAAAIAAYAQVDGLLIARHQGHPHAADLGAEYLISHPPAARAIP